MMNKDEDGTYMNEGDMMTKMVDISMKTDLTWPTRTTSSLELNGLPKEGIYSIRYFTGTR